MPTYGFTSAASGASSASSTASTGVRAISRRRSASMSGAGSKRNVSGGPPPRLIHSSTKAVAKRFCSAQSGPTTATVCAPSSRARRASWVPSDSIGERERVDVRGQRRVVVELIQRDHPRQIDVRSRDGPQVVAQERPDDQSRARFPRPCRIAASTLPSVCAIDDIANAGRLRRRDEAGAHRIGRAAVGRRVEREHERDQGRAGREGDRRRRRDRFGTRWRRLCDDRGLRRQRLRDDRRRGRGVAGTGAAAVERRRVRARRLGCGALPAIGQCGRRRARCTNAAAASSISARAQIEAERNGIGEDVSR